MSTTAGVASQDYVAINLFAVLAAIGGVLSALIFLSMLFFAVPVVTLAMGIVSLRQISHSNGTQTGRLGAWAGIALSLVLSAVLAVQLLGEHRVASGNRAMVVSLCEQFEKVLVAKDYEAAYAMFSPRFKSDRQLDLDTFRQRFEAMAPPQFGELASAKCNGLVRLEASEAGVVFAQTMLIFKWNNSSEEGRFAITFVQQPEGWQIIELPAVFPAPQQAPPPGS
jgi:hypothetical protein